MATSRIGLDKLTVPGDTGADLIAYFNSNMDKLDALLATHKFDATRDPTVNDDNLLGYEVGSWWINRTGNKIFICSDNSTGAAVWDQLYPVVISGTIDADTLEGHPAADFAPAEKAVTNGDMHDHSGGDGGQIAYSSLGGIPSTFAPSAHHGSHESGGSDSIKLDDLATPDDNTDLDVSITKHGLCPKAPNDTSKFLRGDGTWGTVEASGGATFWTDVPGAPTRVSDTQFTVLGDYSRLLSKGTVLVWDESGTWQAAIITSSSFAVDTTTVNICGCSLSAGFSSMKYGMEKARTLLIIIPGTTAVANNPLGGAHRIEVDAYPLAIDYWVGTAGTTNSLTARVNDDGSDIGGNASISSGELTDFGNAPTDSTSAIAADSVITVDITAIHATPAVDLYVRFWYMPASWRDLT